MLSNDSNDINDRVKDLEDDAEETQKTLSLTVYRVNLLYKIAGLLAVLIVGDLFNRLR